MKILIAGGAGYIGTRLSNELHKRGYEITVVDLLWFGNKLDRGIKLLKKDIFSLDTQTLQTFDRVIFIAGLSNDPMAEFSPGLNFIHNAASPSYLAYQAKMAGVPRYIYASSCSVYGNSGEHLSKEGSRTKTLYPYGLSKLQGEFAAEAMVDKNFSVVCLRQGTVCGYSPRMRFDVIVNTMYMKAMTEKKITVYDPTIWRPILSISDAVNAYLKAIEAPLKVSGIFNVSSGNYTVGEVGEKVRSFFKKKYRFEPALEIKNQKNPRNYRASTEKAQKILGLKFTGSIENILDDLHKNVGPQFNFKADKHYNIRVFQKLLKNLAIHTIGQSKIT